jgi:hypothetical protein
MDDIREQVKSIVLGLMFPAMLAAYGLFFILGKADRVRASERMEPDAATAFGLWVCSMAFVVHAFYFRPWSTRPRTKRILIIFGAAVIVISYAVLTWLIHTRPR